MATNAKAAAAPDAPITIKKYANRRLYNTDTSCYITLEELCQMVKQDVVFTVIDAKTEEDLTRQILVQIIFEQESKKFNLLPETFLRGLIHYYDDKMREVLPPYLDAMMNGFTENQEKIQEYYTKSFQQITPFGQLEELRKQNAAFVQNAFGMFNPFQSMFGGKPGDKK